MNWHTLTQEEAIEKLQSSFQGLTSQEAEQRIARYGENKLEQKNKKTGWSIFFAQFKELMILILFGAAIVSAVIGELNDAIVILIIVVLNAIVGFVQEYRAERALEELNKLSSSKAHVMRDGKTYSIPEQKLVPGDVVWMEAGDVVPADIRLLEVHGLKIEEASLTGESHAVDKTVSILVDQEAPLGDRTNMAYKGTMVSKGRGKGVVVGTGMETEMGHIAGMLQQEESYTPLQKRLDDFSKKLALAILGICIVIFGVGLWRGVEPMHMLLTSISVAVAAIPEALPAVITIALALGAKKLVKKKALIRKLPAVETLGSVTYICTDKTGTLTQNKMTFQEYWILSKDKAQKTPQTIEQLFFLAMRLNQDTHKNEKGEYIGDPTELALNEYAREKLQDTDPSLYKRVLELPFDSERKMMTTVHEYGHQFIVFTKGATESLLPLVDPGDRAEISEVTENMAQEGMRVLAYAFKTIERLDETTSKTLEKDLTFLGVAGLIDPPRAEAKDSIQHCRRAGIVPVMITGDYPRTAHKIASDIDIIKNEQDRLMTGQEMARLNEEELKQEVEQIKVYARVSPEQKLNIVKALQDQGHYVAMTGDGVNDAPSLKRANIGIAMGISGTEVSKQAAHMILLDDNFSTIVKAVEEGRRVFDNIRKFIRYIMTGNAGEIWTILLALLVGLPIPLLPIHILWINLVTDGLPSLALANEPAERNNMRHPPRKSSESIFAHGVGWHIVWVGLLIGLFSLGIQYYGIHNSGNHWQTMVFVTLSFTQLFHAFAIRSEYTVIFRHGIFNNMPLLTSLVITIVAQLVLVYEPFLQEVFKTEALTLQELAICFVPPMAIFFAVELEKIFKFGKKAFEVKN